jgi:hypothetical protein
LTEQFVLQELQSLKPELALFYWENNPKKGLAEVDFVIQYEGNIIPIEAKSSINLKAKSLKTYMAYYEPKIAVRTSLARYSRNKTLLDIPLYAIGRLGEFLANSESPFLPPLAASGEGNGESHYSLDETSKSPID